MILEAPSGAVAAQVQIRRAMGISLDNGKSTGFEKSRTFRLIKSPVRSQRPGWAIIDPDTIGGKNCCGSRPPVFADQE